MNTTCLARFLSPWACSFRAFFLLMVYVCVSCHTHALLLASKAHHSM